MLEVLPTLKSTTGLTLSAVAQRPLGNRRLRVLAGAVSQQKGAALVLTDAEDSPFHGLGLPEIWDGAGKTRVRQHVNPLRKEFSTPLPPPNWSTVYTSPEKPLVVDMGCGYGRFLLLLNDKMGPDYNYLGLEIRKPLVDRANFWASRLGVADRLHYCYSNATMSFSSLMSTYPGPLHYVMVQFPDPHFKRRHKKRRILQPSTIRAIVDKLDVGGKIFLQSDIEEVCSAMRDLFEEHEPHRLRPDLQHVAHASTSVVPQGEVLRSRLGTHLEGVSPGDKESSPAACSGGFPLVSESAAPPEVSQVEYRGAQGVPGQIEVSHCHSLSARQPWGHWTGEGVRGSTPGEECGPEHLPTPGSAASSRAEPVNQSTQAQEDNVDALSMLGGLPSFSRYGPGRDTPGMHQAGERDRLPHSGGALTSEKPGVQGRRSWKSFRWLDQNPLGVPTEREHYVLSTTKGEIYRFLLVKQ